MAVGGALVIKIELFETAGVNGDAAITVITPIVLGVIMFGMGLGLTVPDFTRVFKYPKAAVIGLLGQLVVLPVLGLFVATILDLEPELAVGIMILTFCPGGVMSNVMSHLAKADTALSVSLTTVSSFVTPWTTPILVNLSLAYFMGNSEQVQLPLGGTLVKMIMITVVPISLGMLVRSRWPDWALRMDRWVGLLGVFFLVLVMAGITWKERENLPGLMMTAGASTLLLCMVSYGYGILSARLGRLSTRQMSSVCIEVGMQNSTLAMVITLSFLENSRMAIPPMVYSIMMFAVGWVLVAWFHRLNKRAENQ